LPAKRVRTDSHDETTVTVSPSIETTLSNLLSRQLQPVKQGVDSLRQQVSLVDSKVTNLEGRQDLLEAQLLSVMPRHQPPTSTSGPTSAGQSDSALETASHIPLPHDDPMSTEGADKASTPGANTL